ncbi:hypothetical protein D1AOALGA4SA_2142 [Olavius algarvensis Delta 1 endosymbiont]|nr:hypothetical protein D1AOALGA4SA_2142 [Olavius algarvensis Delta 1 endosymbiont]
MAAALPIYYSDFKGSIIVLQTLNQSIKKIIKWYSNQTIPMLSPG